MGRKLSRLVVIDEILEHDNADSLELAIIGGWQCVVRKNQFKEGDIALYHEIDSMLPLDHPFYSFLSGRNEREVDGVSYSRIKTMKLRGEISQGLLTEYPPELLMVSFPSERESRENAVDALNNIIDFDKINRIIKYEPKPKANLSGHAKGNFPDFIPKTDQPRYQNIKRQYESARQKGLVFEVSYKLDGSSFTAYVNYDSEGKIYTGVCSRNLELKKDQEGNMFVDLFNELDLDRKLTEYCETGKPIAIQGEMVGPGIQSNFEGLDKVKLYVYNVFDIVGKKYLYPHQARLLVTKLGLDYVPVKHTFAELPPYEELQDLATGPSGLNGKFREGLVFKEEDGDFTFKVISNDYLLKEK